MRRALHRLAGGFVEHFNHIFIAFSRLDLSVHARVPRRHSPEDLVRELDACVLLLVGPLDVLLQLDGARFDRRQVEAHVEVRGVGAAFHIQHLQMMGGVVLEDILALSVQREDLVQIFVDLSVVRVRVRLAISQIEQVSHGRIQFAGDLYHTGGKVHAAVRCIMLAADIQHQYAVDVKPEVVVSGKLEDDVMAPVVLTARALHEGSRHLHAEMPVDKCLAILGQRDAVQIFVVSGIERMQTCAVDIVDVLIPRQKVGVQIVVGIELAVLERLAAVVSVQCSELIVDLELVRYISVLVEKRGKVLRAVELIVAALVQRLLDEQIVDLLVPVCVCEQIYQGATGLHRRGIAVFAQVSCHQVLNRSSAAGLACSSHDVRLQFIPWAARLSLLRIVIIDHRHGDAVGNMVDGRDRCELSGLALLDDGEIPVVRKRKGRRLERIGILIRKDADVGEFGIVPRDDLGIVIPVAAAVHIDADRMAAHDLVAGDLRRDELAFAELLVIVVFQLVVPVGLPVAAEVFRELPQQVVGGEVIPEDLAAAVIAAHQSAVLVDGEELVAVDLLVPHAGINDDLLLRILVRIRRAEPFV